MLQGLKENTRQEFTDASELEANLPRICRFVEATSECDCCSSQEPAESGVSLKCLKIENVNYDGGRKKVLKTHLTLQATRISCYVPEKVSSDISGCLRSSPLEIFCFEVMD